MPAIPPHDLHALFAFNFPECDWPPARLQALAPAISTRRVADGALLLRQGAATPALFGVLDGHVQARLQAADGQGSVVEQVERLRLFGLASFASGLPSSYEAAALGPTRVALIGPAAYRRLMDEVPGFGRALMREFARRYDGTLRLLSSARHQSAPARLAQALHQLRHEGRARPLPADEGGGWALRVTQAELAARAHLTRQTANECLARWAADGAVRRHYGRLQVMRWPDPG